MFVWFKGDVGKDDVKDQVRLKKEKRERKELKYKNETLKIYE